MVRIGFVMMFLCWFVVAPLSAQTSLFSPDGWFDSRWNEQTDNVGVAASHGLTLVHKADGSVQVWGWNHVAVPPLPPGVLYTDVSTAYAQIALLRSDGEIVMTGGAAGAPPLPAGVVYTQVAKGQSFTAALRSDGQIVAWGASQSGQLNVPPLPAGLLYVEVAVSPLFNYGFGLARRSDGTLVSWGSFAPAPIPALPAGLTYTAISVGYTHAAALRSDGELVAWGSNASGQCAVPPLPVGTHYVQVAAGQYHTLARRSDGAVVAFGDNGFGQCDVPTLPAGTTYVDIAAGGGPITGLIYGQHSVALRSDGSVLAWGDNTWMQCGAPSAPLGVDYVGIAGIDGIQLALRSDGMAVGFGIDGGLDVPAPPAGVTYVEVEPYVGLRSDGQIATWGGNQPLQSVPPLPLGVTYVDLAVGLTHAIARRSDGQVVAWGSNFSGQCFVPALPPNRSYVAIAAGGDNSMALRSDGAVLVWGDNSKGQCSVPWQLAGRECVELATVGPVCFARCSDGDILKWGDPNGGFDVPALPFGVHYVGVSGRFARRSDGAIVQLRSWGTWLPVPFGRSCIDVCDGGAILGPPASYVSFASGCSGSLPPARLVPRDTPRIGQTLVVTLFDLPTDLALVFTGLSTSSSGTVPLPIALGALGMPGCTAFVSPDHLLLLAGANHQATLQFAIPNQPALVGARFHQQAFVPDAGAGNPLLGVVSNAATAIVGR